MGIENSTDTHNTATKQLKRILCPLMNSQKNVLFILNDRLSLFAINHKVNNARKDEDEKKTANCDSEM